MIERFAFATAILASLLSACAGSATRTTSKAAMEFETEKRVIADTTGDAKGNDYTGTFDVAIDIASGSRECWGSNSVREKVESGPVPAKATLECTQTDDHMECTYSKIDLDVKGFIKATGNFAVFGEFSRKTEKSDSSTKGQVVLNATFKDANNFSGKFLAKTLTTIQKNSAFCTYEFPCAAVRTEGKAADTHTADGKASVTLSIDHGAHVRSFSDIQSRTVDGHTEIGGKRGDTERFTAVLNEDGSADVTARVMGSDGTALVEGALEHCVFDRSGPDAESTQIKCLTARSL